MTTCFSKQEGEIFKSRQAGALKYSTSEAQTPIYVEVLFLFTHCSWLNASTARQECAILNSVHYLQNYRQTPHICCGLLAAKFPRL